MLLFATALTGCADLLELNSRNPKLSLPPANPAEYEPYRQAGTGSISGQAFVLTTSGDPKKAAGKQVTLDPATSVARAWWNTAKAYQKLEPRLPDDPNFAAARKTTTADAEGRFTFEGLPPGDYLVRTTVHWKPLYCSENSFCSSQSGVMGGLVHLGPGEKKGNVIFGEDAKALGEEGKKK
jgi:hypothetical protein